MFISLTLMVCQSGNYYFKAYDNNQRIMINLFDQNFDVKEVKVHPVSQVQNYGSLALYFFVRPNIEGAESYDSAPCLHF